MSSTPTSAVPDWRHISNGREIPTEFYSDQPYVVQTDDGAWLCTVTTGPGHEGNRGQHVVTLRSTDQGRTWSAPVDVEPSTGPEASYAVMLKVPSGRIYIFYNHNTDNLRRVQADRPAYPDGWCTRVDSIGHYVCKYSDDHGRSWSRARYPVPVREFEIDRHNADGGKLRYFWNVGRPFIHQGAAYASLHKVGGFGEGFFTSSEGVLLHSANLLTEPDPARITWETLPDGDRGLRTPPGGGPIAEEQSYVVLSDGSFYVVYRSTDGHPVCATSRDGGHTWSTPRYQTYADGRRMKHPRAANFVWRLANGRFLYWFHHHGGTWYDDRNPVWLCGGVEVDGPDGRTIAWSQPEVFLYDDDTFIRMSYPDLIEQDGKVWITETQKDIARVHAVPADFLAQLTAVHPVNGPVRDGLLLGLDAPPANVPAPRLPEFAERDINRPDYGQKNLRTGFTLDVTVTLSDLTTPRVLLDNRRTDGHGFALQSTTLGTVEIILNDGRTENRWTCDPGLLTTNRRHHVAVIVDAGPHLISFVVDGRFCDGGSHRQFGWGRFSPDLRDVNGAAELRIASDCVHSLRVYDRALRTAEAVANHTAAGS